MSHQKIKLTQVPRLALALVALMVFFTTLYYELIQRPISFTEPFWGGLMIGFLFAGVAMLAVSWIIGLDTRGEVYITLFMIGLHIGFDVYIFVRVFALHLPLSVPLVQGVVQAYWIAGLLDVLLMFWATNWERTAGNYISPEKQLEITRQELEQERRSKALLEADMRHVIKDAEKASRVYTEACEGCGRVFEAPSQAQARAKRDGHKRACQGVKVSSNGNGHARVAAGE